MARAFSKMIDRGWIALAVLFGSLGTGGAFGQDIGPVQPGAFDYYVLSLSSEPGFCATSHSKSVECTTPRGFALHGLWPELEGGKYPSNCAGAALTADQQSLYAPIYPDPTMIGHEWPKHGTCSGLSPDNYFHLAASDQAAVVVPAAYRGPKPIKSGSAIRVRQAFVKANPGLSTADLRVVTLKGYVTQVDLCVTKAGVFRSC